MSAVDRDERVRTVPTASSCTICSPSSEIVSICTLLRSTVAPGAPLRQVPAGYRVRAALR